MRSYTRIEGRQAKLPHSGTVVLAMCPEYDTWVYVPCQHPIIFKIRAAEPTSSGLHPFSVWKDFLALRVP